MKRYRLLKDLPGYKKGLEFEVAENGGIGISEGVDIPTLKFFYVHISDREWFEEIKEEKPKRWRAENGEDYMTIGPRLITFNQVDASGAYDTKIYDSGNYFNPEWEEDVEKTAKQISAFYKIFSYCKTQGFDVSTYRKSESVYPQSFITYDPEFGFNIGTNGHNGGSYGFNIFFRNNRETYKCLEDMREEWEVLYGIEKTVPKYKYTDLEDELHDNI